jgi:Zn/Cd-binding protein ZinT
MGMSALEKDGHFSRNPGYKMDDDPSRFYDSSSVDDALSDYDSQRHVVYPDLAVSESPKKPTAVSTKTASKISSSEPTYLLPAHFEKEGLQSLFFEEHICIDSFSHHPHVDVIPSDFLSDEIFSILQSEKNTLETQINILEESVSQLETLLHEESAKINADITTIEHKMKDVQFHSEAGMRESNYVHLSTQLLMLKQNKRQFESQIVEDLEKKRILISEKARELAVLDMQIRLLSNNLFASDPFS